MRLIYRFLHGLEAVDQLCSFLFAKARLDHLAQDAGSAEVEVFADVCADLVGPSTVDDHLESDQQSLRFVS